MVKKVVSVCFTAWMLQSEQFLPELDNILALKEEQRAVLKVFLYSLTLENCGQEASRWLAEDSSNQLPCKFEAGGLPFQTFPTTPSQVDM